MRWNLENWLEARRVTRYELARNMSGNVKTRLTSLYRMRDPKRIDLSVMGEIVAALRQITGEEVTPNDLLEFVPDAKPEQMDAETKAWLESDLSRLGELDAYEWAEGEADEGEVLRYVPGQGWASEG